jgi:hypothetical protein
MILTHAELEAIILLTLTRDCGSRCMDDATDVLCTVKALHTAIIEKELDILSNIDEHESRGK